MSQESDALLGRAQAVGIGASAFMLLLTLGTASAMWMALYRGLGTTSRIVYMALLLTVVSVAPALEIAMLRRLARGAPSAWTPTVICTSACLLVAVTGVFLPIFAWIVFGILLAITYAYEIYVLLRLRSALPVTR